MELLSLLEESSTFFLIVIGILSLLIGSFLNVLIYRLPEMLQRGWKQECTAFLELEPESNKAPVENTKVFNLSYPASHCPSCNHAVRSLDNIPIISYLLLGGRCRDCKAPISIRYPLIEALTAGLSILVAMQFGYSLQTVIGLIFTWSLISLTMIDIDTQLLPDNITLPLLWLALFASLFKLFIDPTTAIIGALAGYLSLWLVYWLFKLATGKEGMGYGDFKLLAALGALLGWQMLPLIIMLSAFVGATVGILLIAIKGHDKNKPIPFGPYLSAAGFIALIWGAPLNQYYSTLLAL